MMPSVSDKQQRFMAAAANNPDFAKRAGIDRSVAREFHNADKRRGMARGGMPDDAQVPISGGPLSMGTTGDTAGAPMTAAGPRTYTPLADDKSYYRYGQTGGEHMFFSGAPSQPAPNADANMGPSVTGRPAGPTGGRGGSSPLASDPMGGTRIGSIPVPQGRAPLGGGRTGNDGIATTPLRNLAETAAGIGDPTRAGANVSSLLGPQHSVPTRFLGGMGRAASAAGLDSVGFNNPFSQIGRALNSPIHLTDPGGGGDIGGLRQFLIDLETSGRTNRFA